MNVAWASLNDEKVVQVGARIEKYEIRCCACCEAEFDDHVTTLGVTPDRADHAPCRAD